jgi:hypothetical protein
MAQVKDVVAQVIDVNGAQVWNVLAPVGDLVAQMWDVVAQVVDVETHRGI